MLPKILNIIVKNGNLADLLESRGDAEMAKKLRSIEQVLRGLGKPQ